MSFKCVRVQSSLFSFEMHVCFVTSHDKATSNPFRQQSFTLWVFGGFPASLNCGLVLVGFNDYIINTSSTAQGGGGSFKNRKPIGEVGCCESGIAERSH